MRRTSLWTPRHVVNTFSPPHAPGGAIDGGGVALERRRDMEQCGEKRRLFHWKHELGSLIRHGYAYPLPHRGFSRGDGNGWSRQTMVQGGKGALYRLRKASIVVLRGATSPNRLI